MLFEYHQRVEALEADNSRLREALEQYADGENWIKTSSAGRFERVWFPNPRVRVDDDHGYTIARRVLGGEESNEKAD
jgi:hypothetical protein